MGRLLLIAAIAYSRIAHAQDPVSAYEDLARKMESRDWRGALYASRAVLDVQANPTELRQSVECMHVLLLELDLREHLAASPEGITELSTTLSGISSALRQLGEAYPKCNRDAPASIAPHANALRHRELSYVQPRVERAATLAGEARESGSVSAELEEVFVREFAELVAQIPPGPEDAWERAEHLWREQRTPEPRAREWTARSEAPAFGTMALIGGFGLVSFFSTLTALSGSGLPSLSAGGWGITFSLLPALASAWTWEAPKRGLLVASLALTAVAAAGGVAAIAQLDRDGRYFGRGLLIGSAVSVMWQVGGWIHYRYPDRSRREWRERVRVAPTGGPGFGGLTATGRF